MLQVFVDLSKLGWYLFLAQSPWMTGSSNVDSDVNVLISIYFEEIVSESSFIFGLISNIWGHGSFLYSSVID